ncbi:uncharacterized protein A4U43_C10F9310 [Asparagus officinalis]|uniref:Uncharacterized protein n=1 Tax=Asparagus officinalis TaxID=4686 RepID=A0A5P1E1K3_ASPOF|nr:uncharacterized protein A4U43_C10F9310 [Asparagus officinalis]
MIKHHIGESTRAPGRREYQQFEESEEAPFKEAGGYEGMYDFAEPAFQTQYALSQPNIAIEEETEEEAEELTKLGQNNNGKQKLAPLKKKL